MRPVKTALLALALVLSTGNIQAQDVVSGCPENLDVLANWYETSPDLGQIAEVNMLLTFTNTSGEQVEFSAVADDTMQLWTTPSVDDPLPVYNIFPTGFVENGENFSYNITIDTANMTSWQDGFGIRPHTINLGNLGPNGGRSTLVSAAFDCIAGRRYNDSAIPASSNWSTLALLALILGMAAFTIRQRIS